MWELHLAPNIIYKKWTQFNLISFLCIIVLWVIWNKTSWCVCVGGGGIEMFATLTLQLILFDLDIWSDIYNDMHHQ